MLVTALAGAMIAISFSAPPGPVALETIRRGLHGGFRSALGVQLGSLVGDVLWCSLALLGLAPLAQVAWVRAILSAAGVGVLFYLGIAGIRDAVALARTPPASGAHPRDGGGAFRSGLAISMANPMAVGYWLSVGGALVAAGVAGTTTADTAWFLFGFAGGTLAWAVCMACAVRWGRLVLTPALYRGVAFVCGAVLMMFGIVLALRMFDALL